MKIVLNRTARIVSVASVLIYAGTAQGAGFALIEQSVKGLGNAFAGAAAVAEDASTIFFNPAGLTRLQGQQVLIGGHLIIPVAEFHNRDSTNAIGGRTTGRTESDAGVTRIAPNFYYARDISGRIKFGLGVFAPFALSTKYDKDWIGRYHAIDSEITTVNINPALAYRVNERFSIGAGVSAQYIDVTLSQAIDFGTLAFLSGIPGTSPSTPAFDGFSKVKGDDWGYGFNLGLLYAIDPNTRLGFAYRSPISHTLKGHNGLTVPTHLTQYFRPSTHPRIRADNTLPETVSLSGYHQLNDHWAVMADATWTRWSRFDELRIQFEDGSESVQPQDWRNTWRYSLGLSYTYSPEWTLRAGIAYDRTPIPNVARRTPRIPDNSRTWIALGGSYQASPNLSFDFGYTHLFLSDPQMNDTEITTGNLAGLPIGNTLRGEYAAQIDIVSAQVQWSF
jgi:long-chain fatty acid transport protein